MADLRKRDRAVLASTDDALTRDPELEKRARHYSDMALRHSTVTMQERRDFPTGALRHLNSFVKACVIDTTCRTLGIHRDLHVADIAGGRGQDISKFHYAHPSITAYYGLDLSAEDCVSASILAEKYLPTAKAAGGVSILAGDMCRGFPHIPDGSVDVVSCQMAVHYLFGDEAHVATFFREAKRVLDPKRGGLVLVSYADGRAIVRRGREALAKSPGTPETPTITVSYRSKYYGFTIAVDHLAAAIRSPYGNKYEFFLPGCIEGLEEYLAHEGLLRAAAQAEGFMAGLSMSFDGAGLFFHAQPRFREIARKMGGHGLEDPDAVDTANLYRFGIFAFGPHANSVLHQWSINVTN